MRRRRLMGMTPSHPGEFVRREILEPLGLSVSQVADILGVRRATLSDLGNGRAALSPEIALRIEKAFKVGMDVLLRMQPGHEAARMRQGADEIAVEHREPACRPGDLRVCVC